jgi:hypothetical protein
MTGSQSRLARCLRRAVAGWAIVTAGAALLAACGAQVAPSAAGQGAAWAHLPGIPAATLRAVAVMQGAAIRPLTPGQRAAMRGLAHGEAVAVGVALARHRPRSQALGVTVARVQAHAAGLGKPRVVWLVSVDPYGGEYPAGSTACSGAVIWPANYVIDVVRVTGRWLARWAGHVRGVPELPVLGKQLPPRHGSLCPPALPGS